MTRVHYRHGAPEAKEKNRTGFAKASRPDADFDAGGRIWDAKAWVEMKNIHVLYRPLLREKECCTTIRRVSASLHRSRSRNNRTNSGKTRKDSQANIDKGKHPYRVVSGPDWAGFCACGATAAPCAILGVEALRQPSFRPQKQAAAT